MFNVFFFPTQDAIDLSLANKTGDTPLAFAALYKHQHMVERLIEMRADANTLNALRWSPLYYAVNNDDEAMVELLLTRGGARVDLDTQTPLLVKVVTTHGSEGIARLLIQHGVDVNFEDQHGRTALYYAVRQLNVDCVQLLLAQGGDPNSGRPPALMGALETPYAVVRVCVFFFHLSC